MIEHDDARLRLLVVTDDLRDGTEGLVARATAAARGGATMVLLRLKHVDAATLVEVGRALVQALPVPVIVNERLDVALACGAAGVQLTSWSMPVVAVRPQVAPDFLIGASVSGPNDVLSAAGADYVTIGPVFGGGSEALGLDGFRSLLDACGRPGIAIGGIDVDTATTVRTAGAAGVAVISAVMGSADVQSTAAALWLAVGDR